MTQVMSERGLPRSAAMVGTDTASTVMENPTENSPTSDTVSTIHR